MHIIWAKAAKGVLGLVHVFNNKLFFTRDIMDDDTVPKHFSVPEPKPKSGSKGQHIQEFRMLYNMKKGFGPKPVFFLFWRKSCVEKKTEKCMIRDLRFF